MRSFASQSITNTLAIDLYLEYYTTGGLVSKAGTYIHAHTHTQSQPEMDQSTNNKSFNLNPIYWKILEKMCNYHKE